MSEKPLEYAACIFAKGVSLNVGGPRSQFLSEKDRVRITRDDRVVCIEELFAPFRMFEVPRELCVLERRRAPDGPSVAKTGDKK